ncbi:hypothetical protein KY358_07175, partial [Candidatus Woesearchaeota archaeon]|nr:hypothetical protein [Candidatus Woesearchaeota archaeon]
MINKRHIEAGALIIFVLVFFYLGLSNMWGRSLSHEKPYAYLASDAFLHFSVSEYSLAEGRFKYA